jgi:N-carbamoyl-L-amino-acid hydrolase
MPDTRIDGARLWRSLMELAEIGATDRGGVRRLALTKLDGRGRDLFVRWCEDLGLGVSVDGVGNLFARRDGSEPSRPPIVAGSHLDTQPSGGKFDGCYGVMAALEVARTLADRDITTIAPFEVVVWTNEEGTRFRPAMSGSGAFAGVLDVDTLLATRDDEGVCFGDALAEIGYSGPFDVGGRALGAYFEAHIEQGPVLEDEHATIGVVTGAMGLRWLHVDFSGTDAHAGPTPMCSRHDAGVGAAELIVAVDTIGRRSPTTRATCGVVRFAPSSINVIPGHAHVSVDLRSLDLRELEAMERDVRGHADKFAAARGLEVVIERVLESAPMRFDDGCIGDIRRAARARAYELRELPSGAAHDAINIARVAPTGMVFVPCAGGISHNETESAEPDDLAAGCQVLCDVVLARAGVAPTEARSS